MQHDPTPIEEQIATLILGIEVFDQAQMDAAAKQRFPNATEAQTAKAADIVVDILNAVAEAYEAQAEAYAAALARRTGNGAA